MAIKAVCVVGYVEVSSSDATKFMVTVSIAGIESGNPVSTTIIIGPFAANIGSSFLTSDIKNAVEAHLVNNHSYSFNPLTDEVRLLGSLI